jgi:hypothetical protein
VKIESLSLPCQFKREGHLSVMRIGRMVGFNHVFTRITWAILGKFSSVCIIFRSLV